MRYAPRSAPFDPHLGLVLAPRAGRKPGLTRSTAVPARRPRRVFFVAVTYTTVIPTDLITPLGAYVRLRGNGEAAFLLESVEHGRLGRHSFVGAGTRVVGLEEAESETAPVVGFIAYD